MQEFLNWTIDTIRNDRLISPWLEEKKFEWTPIVGKSVTNILDNGKSVIILTDNDREWFLEYIMCNINSPKNNRPLLPFYSFKSLFNQIESIKTDKDISLLKDMLNISFPNGFIIWYIGKGNDPKAAIAKMSKSSFLWLFDEERQDAFNLRSSDEALEMKLLQMFRLYNKTLSSVLFAEIAVDS